ncbi:MAG: S8 family serine peptidase [Pseudomonadota bacterium]
MPTISGAHKAIGLTLACALLSACGGGSSAPQNTGPAEPVAPAPNPAPIADAGTNFNAREGEDVSVLGTVSDADGSISSVGWRQIDGTPVALQNADTARLQFQVPTLQADASATFELTVVDDDGASDADQLQIGFLANFDLAGAVFAAPGVDTDGDVNDPNTELLRNNDLATAQPIANPVLIGGFVNRPGTGEQSGQLRSVGDVDDFYRLSAVANQLVSLFIESERPAINDLDLLLLDAEGNLLDTSVSFSAFEQITIPADGEYLVGVTAFSGASSYLLSVGQSVGEAIDPATALRLSDDFVVNQVVARLREEAVIAKGGMQAFSKREGLQALGGGQGRRRLLDTRTMRATAHEKAAIAHYLSFTKDEETAEKLRTLLAAKALGKRDDVRSASLNYWHQSSLQPVDEFASLQWHYPAIGLPAAWDLTQGDASVIVAVVDTGVLTGHPDFAGKLTPGFDFISSANNARDGDGIDDDPDDPGDLGGGGGSSFHGTHVAGTVGALTDNGTGVSGSGWNTRIMPLRALGRFGGSSFDIAQAMRYAAGLPNDSGRLPDQRADVINLSLGGAGFSQSTQDLIDEIRAVGVVVVAAAGNSSSSAPSFPAAYDGVISVSAADINSNIASYSNFGPTIDLAAPGGSTGTDVNGDGFGDGVLSTIGDDSSGEIRFGYGFLQGTSMASPHVAGVIALMKAVAPQLTPALIDELIENGSLSDDLGASGRDDLYGHGMVNALDAVLAAIEVAGGELPEPRPVAVASPPALNFGITVAAQRITVSNVGTGELQVEPPVVDPSAPWLTAETAQVDAAGEGEYLLRVARDGLAPGTYQGEVRFATNGGEVAVAVIMQAVDGEAELGSAGNQFVLLIDDDTGEVIAQAEPGTVRGNVSYEFPNVPPGRYLIVSGTDMDADGFICDAAEACGAFPVLDPLELQVVTIEGDRDDLDFITTFNGELASAEAAAAAEDADSQVASAARGAMGTTGIPLTVGARLSP